MALCGQLPGQGHQGDRLLEAGGGTRGSKLFLVKVRIGKFHSGQDLYKFSHSPLWVGQPAAAGTGQSGAFCCRNSGSCLWVCSPGRCCFCAQSAAGLLMLSVCSQSPVCMH